MVDARGAGASVATVAVRVTVSLLANQGVGSWRGGHGDEPGPGWLSTVRENRVPPGPYLVRIRRSLAVRRSR
ncbi:hypothetical protein GCM10023339_63340 [Alloalcanivorax gelatiniphagus]